MFGDWRNRLAVDFDLCPRLPNVAETATLG